MIISSSIVIVIVVIACETYTDDDNRMNLWRNYVHILWFSVQFYVEENCEKASNYEMHTAQSSITMYKYIVHE